MMQRMYHVSCISFNIKKQAQKLNKLLNPKNKRRWYPSDLLAEQTLPSIKSLTKVEREPGKRGIRRIAMLNKVFMKNIADIMSTGTVAMEIVGRGIEISKVKMSQDFKFINVYWVSKGDSRDVDIEEMLNKRAGVLRHELSVLRVMGEVPRIVFVKDNEEAQLIELDKRLSRADYGEDFTPTEIGHLLKSEFVLNTQLSPEIKAKIKQLEDDMPTVEEPLPEMTNSMYGLEHEKIMNRLLSARKTSRDAWSSLEDNRHIISYKAATNRSTEVDIDQQKGELAEFFLKRKILHNKMLKQLRDDRNLQVTPDNEQDEESLDNDFDDDDEYYEKYYYDYYEENEDTNKK